MTNGTSDHKGVSILSMLYTILDQNHVFLEFITCRPEKRCFMWRKHYVQKSSIQETQGVLELNWVYRRVARKNLKHGIRQSYTCPTESQTLFCLQTYIVQQVRRLKYKQWNLVEAIEKSAETRFCARVLPRIVGWKIEAMIRGKSVVPIYQTSQLHSKLRQLRLFAFAVYHLCHKDYTTALANNASYVLVSLHDSWPAVRK